MNEITIFNSVILLFQFFAAYLVIVIANKNANNYIIEHFQPYESNKKKIIKETERSIWAGTITGAVFIFIFIKLDKFGLAGGLKIVNNTPAYDNLLFNPPFFIALIFTYFFYRTRKVRSHIKKYKILNNEDWYTYRKKLIEQI